MPVKIFFNRSEFFLFSLATIFWTVVYHGKKQVNDIFEEKVERAVMKN